MGRKVTFLQMFSIIKILYNLRVYVENLNLIFTVYSKNAY
jgi:hypothetical protein